MPLMSHPQGHHRFVLGSDAVERLNWAAAQPSYQTAHSWPRKWVVLKNSGQSELVQVRSQGQENKRTLWAVKTPVIRAKSSVAAAKGIEISGVLSEELRDLDLIERPENAEVPNIGQDFVPDVGRKANLKLVGFRKLMIHHLAADHNISKIRRVLVCNNDVTKLLYEGRQKTQKGKNRRKWFVALITCHRLYLL